MLDFITTLPTTYNYINTKHRKRQTQYAKEKISAECPPIHDKNKKQKQYDQQSTHTYHDINESQGATKCSQQMKTLVTCECHKFWDNRGTGNRIVPKHKEIQLDCEKQKHLQIPGHTMEPRCATQILNVNETMHENRLPRRGTIYTFRKPLAN